MPARLEQCSVFLAPRVGRLARRAFPGGGIRGDAVCAELRGSGRRRGAGPAACRAGTALVADGRRGETQSRAGVGVRRVLGVPVDRVADARGGVPVGPRDGGGQIGVRQRGGPADPVKNAGACRGVARRAGDSCFGNHPGGLAGRFAGLAALADIADARADPLAYAVPDPRRSDRKLPGRRSGPSCREPYFVP